MPAALPEASGDVVVLHGLLDHQAPLLPQGQHGGHDGQGGAGGGLVVQPQLVEGHEGACAADPCAAVDQHGTCRREQDLQLTWPGLPVQVLGPEQQVHQQPEGWTTLTRPPGSLRCPQVRPVLGLELGHLAGWVW